MDGDCDIDMDTLVAGGERAPLTSHPLLMDHVLENIFEYFENDRSNLTSFRLVCQDWNYAASRTVKKSLRWRIGPVHDPAQHEARFLEMVSACENDLFRNFHLCNGQSLRRTDMEGLFQEQLWFPPGRHHDLNHLAGISDPPGIGGATGSSIPAPARHPSAALHFLENCGSSIIDLKIIGSDRAYLDYCLQRTTNLKHLEIYGLWMPPVFIQPFRWKFPHLVEARVLSNAQLDDISRSNGSNILACIVQEKFAAICSSIMAAAPNLGSLETNSVLVVSGILGAEPQFADLAGLARLTCLKIHGDTGLLEEDIDNIREHCTGLKKFAAAFIAGYSLEMEAAILRLVHKLGPQLEELCLDAVKTLEPPIAIILRDGVSPRPASPNEYAFPDLPRIKKLILKNWDMYNNFNFAAPKLRHLEAALLTTDPPMSLLLSSPFRNVRILRIALSHVTSDGVRFLAALFPRVQELDCTLENDESLSLVCELMPQLKRLYLNHSQITDCGITGLHQHDLEVITRENWAFDDEFAGKVDGVIKFPKRSGIGDLKGLEHFSILPSKDRGTVNLSRYSVYLGFVLLKELKDLTLPPFGSPLRTEHGQWTETVPARALADNCPVLAKLNVCGGTHLPRARSTKLGFGCGLTDEVIAYVKTKLPYLELAHNNPGSLSGLIHAGHGNNVVIV